jgi:ABC-type glycerol-3-phosphate transport system substrate-binding protein
MELKKTLSTATLLLASTFVLAACGGADTETETESSVAASSEVVAESSSEAASEAMQLNYKTAHTHWLKRISTHVAGKLNSRSL